VIEQNDLSCAPAEAIAKVGVYPAFPVAMAKRGGCRRDGELMRDEIVVRDSVRGEMREITKTERSHRLRLRLLVDLEADVPRMTMPSCSSVFLRDARVRSDTPIEEIVRKRSDDLRDRCRQQRERPEDRLTEEDVRARCPRVSGGRRDGDRKQRDAHHAKHHCKWLSS
jgi:hypothetical protein